MIEEEIDHSLKEMINVTTVDSTVTGNPNADQQEAETVVVECNVVEDLIEIDLEMVASEEEIIVDLMMTEEVNEMAIDSVEEVDLDPALQETIEVHQELATMTSEDREETDLDLVAEMDLHTVENGIEMRTDIPSEEA